MVGSSPAQPAIVAPRTTTPRGHTLKKIWYTEDTDRYDTDGWWWACHCGTSGPSSTGRNDITGSEAKGMAAWKAHAHIYRDLDSGDSWEEKYKELEKKHNEYVDACICKNL